MSAKKLAIHVSVAVLCAAGAARADVLVRSNGSKVGDVSVVQARWDQVQYKQGGQAFSLKGEEVESVERDSRQLSTIRDAMDRGDLASAVAAAGKLKQNSSVDWEKAEAAYIEGKLQHLAGDYKAAEAAYKSFLDAHEAQKDWWVPHAVYGRGVCALEQNQGRTAELHFKALDAFGPQWSLRAKLGQGNALLVSQKPIEARQLFNEVARSSQASLSLAQEALVGKARALILQKDYRGAVGELEKEFFSNSKPGQLLYNQPRAEACYLIGSALKAQGGKENLELAEIWYLRTAAIFSNHASVYRRACKDLADVYTQLGRTDRAEEWKRRAGA